VADKSQRTKTTRGVKSLNRFRIIGVTTTVAAVALLTTSAALAKECPTGKPGVVRKNVKRSLIAHGYSHFRYPNCFHVGAASIRDWRIDCSFDMQWRHDRPQPKLPAAKFNRKGRLIRAGFYGYSEDPSFDPHWPLISIRFMTPEKNPCASKDREQQYPCGIGWPSGVPCVT
jgi:hypothetical protein